MLRELVGGHVYAATDPIAGAFTLQFQNVPIKGAGSATVTCQLILKTTGEILMQYQSLGLSNTCTVGVQNAAASQGLQVACNQNYLQSGMAASLSPTPWLGLAANAGLVPRSNADVVDLTLNPASVPNGTYTATLLVQTADPALPLTALPVRLNVLTAPSGLTVSTATWAQVSLTWRDNAGTELFFDIERKTGTNGVYALLAQVSAGVTNFTDVTVSSRTTYGYRVRAVNTGYSAYSEEAFATTPMSPIEQWRLAWFGTADNAGIAADTADPDHDGVINVLDYAFNTNPLVPHPSPVSFALAGGHLMLSFKRAHPPPADLLYVPAVADDLVSGNWLSSGAGSPTTMVIDNHDGTESVSVYDSATMSTNTARYLRLQINRISRP